MNKKLKTDAVDHLFQAVLCLKTQDECYDFFEDLCTVNELLSLSQRFEVANSKKPIWKLPKKPAHPPQPSAVSTVP